ncbi:hypothetical protein [Desulfovibrio sp. UCD-KL4C]|uniref:hypothetical protein n=1 Tax=Desulfovibrio sp. UCD-KL4C TaxID=2578120 RepID=UPI0025C1B952|nr:hypothetical protein [Desulfovibrio sp. UCD-KL4C]
MPIRSDVTIFLSEAGLTRLNKQLANAQQKLSKSELIDLQEMLDRNKNSQTGQAYGGNMFCWLSCEWRSSHPMVKLVNTVFDEMDTEEFSFLRISEDEKEFEVRGDYYNNQFEKHVRQNQLSKSIS